MALAISVLDVAQPLCFPWQSRYVGALAGAAVYGSAALLLLLTTRRFPLWVALLLPLLPATSLALLAAGVELPVQADGWMVGIFVLQVLASLGAAAALRMAGRKSVGLEPGS